jgi:lipoyl(octanoyl) transferase
MQLLQVLQLGTLDYSTALKLQETLVELRKQGRIANTLLLLEHPAVITLGRNAQERNIIASPEFLAEQGVEIFKTKRGGDVTFHGPGQLVGYPICDLRGFSPRIGAVEFVRRIEEVLIRACAEFGIGTKRICKLTGVWTEGEKPFNPEDTESTKDTETLRESCSDDVNGCERKIAAIGVHISRGVTSHGFALNVTTDLEQFKLIVPCGISDKPVTSMEQELGAEKTPVMEAVRNAVTRQFGNVFGVQILWLESLESLLKTGDASTLVPTLSPNATDKDVVHPLERDGGHSGPPNQDTPLREPDDLKRLREDFEAAPNDDIHFA